MARLRKTLAQSEVRMRDLRVLLTAEHQRLSGVFVERRKVFLNVSQAGANAEFYQRLFSLPVSRNGPVYRRNVNHLAQEIVHERLKLWLESEAGSQGRSNAKRRNDSSN
jgi:hypothetical protein